jgi:long-chain-acyl-CoA dehydrogenase
LLETVQFAKDRKAFGQSIGAFQHNKFLLAELVTQIEVAEAYVDKCVAAHARAWRDARVTKIWAGSNEIMKELIGRDLGF